VDGRELDIDPGMPGFAAERERDHEVLVVDIDELVHPEPNALENLHLVSNEADRAVETAPLVFGERAPPELEHDLGIECPSTCRRHGARSPIR
jgi:hypothetical protein